MGGKGNYAFCPAPILNPYNFTRGDKMKRSLSLGDIIKIANEAYPDNKVLEAYEQLSKGKKYPNVGDGLAEFVARELQETFESGKSRQEQLERVLRAMTTARRELEAVEQHLYNEVCKFDTETETR
jgi:hypothetical protein